VTGNYGNTQYYVTFAQTGVGTDYTANDVMTVGGVNYGRAGHSDWYNSGDKISFSYSSPLVVTASSTQYVLTVVDHSSPLTVTSATNVIGTYKTQYYLTLNNGGHGSVAGQGWYDAGTDASFSVSPDIVSGSAGTQYVFKTWTGTGDSHYDGPNNPGSVVMNSPMIETAGWTTQYFLTVNNGGLGVTTGQGWSDAGTTANFGISPLTVTNTVGTYNFSGWTGEGNGNYSGPGANHSVVMNNAITETAIWAAELPEVIEIPPIFELTIQLLGGPIVPYPVNADGVVLVDVNQTSPDGSMTLIIPAGTVVLNFDGSPAYRNPDPDIKAVAVGNLAGLPSGVQAVKAYQMTWNGEIFKIHNITLAVRYAAGDIPSGKTAVWAYYDTVQNKWVEVDTAGFVSFGTAVPNSAAGQVSHFTLYAIIAK
jgi:hypothetical protein